MTKREGIQPSGDVLTDQVSRYPLILTARVCAGLEKKKMLIIIINETNAIRIGFYKRFSQP